MALNNTGPISLAGSTTGQSIALEIGQTATSTISFQTANVRTLSNTASGSTVVMPTNFYGRSLATNLTISATTTNYNIFTAAGSPTSATTVNLAINAGVTVGGVGGTPAITVGQFPAGSTITINNSGLIVGTGGTAGSGGVGGNGGNAILANYANQTMVINNLAGATIAGGGGGGGKGGTGGPGVYQSGVESAGPASAPSYLNCDIACSYVGANYCQGGCISGDGDLTCTDCARYTYTGTSGGTGGAGGQGAGYAQTSAAGSSGSGGGTNAGSGGTGGSGGAYGVNGSTGATGNGGNAGGGSAGSAGGTRGNYLVKGANTVTVNNSGTLSGGLA